MRRKKEPRRWGGTKTDSSQTYSNNTGREEKEGIEKTVGKKRRILAFKFANMKGGREGGGL